MATLRRTFSFDVLTAYTMAFSIATLAFVRGLFTQSPPMLAFAGWMVLSIGIAWARRRQSLDTGRDTTAPGAHIGVDGWGGKAIAATAILAMLLGILWTALR